MVQQAARFVLLCCVTRERRHFARFEVEQTQLRLWVLWLPAMQLLPLPLSTTLLSTVPLLLVVHRRLWSAEPMDHRCHSSRASVHSMQTRQRITSSSGLITPVMNGAVPTTSIGQLTRRSDPLSMWRRYVRFRLLLDVPAWACPIGHAMFWATTREGACFMTSFRWLLPDHAVYFQRCIP